MFMSLFRTCEHSGSAEAHSSAETYLFIDTLEAYRISNKLVVVVTSPGGGREPW